MSTIPGTVKHKIPPREQKQKWELENAVFLGNIMIREEEKKKSHKLGGITVGSTLSTLRNPRLKCDAGFQKLSVVVYREGREMWKYSFLPFSRLELQLYYLMSSHPLHHQVETGSSFQEASTNPRSPVWVSEAVFPFIARQLTLLVPPCHLHTRSCRLGWLLTASSQYPSHFMQYQKE